MSTTLPPDPSGELFDDVPSEDTPSDADRSWYTKNSWIVTPLIVFIIIGLLCIALHTYRVRRLRRRVQLIREEARESGGRNPALYDVERAQGLFARHNRALLYLYNRHNDNNNNNNNNHNSHNSNNNNNNNNNNSNSNNNININDNNSESPNLRRPAQAAAPRPWGERWQWRGTTNRQDDGLDEFGEAPPPYEHKKESATGNENADGSTHAAAASLGRADGLELAQMEPRGEAPPVYGAAVGPQEDGSSLPARPEPTPSR